MNESKFRSGAFEVMLYKKKKVKVEKSVTTDMKIEDFLKKYYE